MQKIAVTTLDRHYFTRLARILPLAILFSVGALGAFLPQTTALVTGGPVNSGDVAWMLAARSLRRRKIETLRVAIEPASPTYGL